MVRITPVLLGAVLILFGAAASAQTAEQPETAAQPGAAEEQEAQAFEITGDPEAGERVFLRCRACHTVEPDRNLVGPTLFDVIGREAGAVEGFNYSPALKESEVVWTPENLHAYLEAPAEFIPGNRMIFAGLKNEEDRENVITYLAQQTQVAKEAGEAAE